MTDHHQGRTQQQVESDEQCAEWTVIALGVIVLCALLGWAVHYVVGLLNL